MNALLLAVDDGWTNANYNWADFFFLLGTLAALLAAVSYASGNRTTVSTTTEDHPRRAVVGFHAWAAALLAFGVACVAFALFLL